MKFQRYKDTLKRIRRRRNKCHDDVALVRAARNSTGCIYLCMRLMKNAQNLQKTRVEEEEEERTFSPEIQLMTGTMHRARDKLPRNQPSQWIADCAQFLFHLEWHFM